VLLANVALSATKINCRFMPAERYCLRAAGKKKSFDYIFCDPPFPYRFKEDLLIKIAGGSLLGDASLLMMHRPSSDRFDEKTLAANGLILSESRTYGRSIVDFWRHRRFSSGVH
jgi:16S rRNA G966 N2-methylase RsmD